MSSLPHIELASWHYKPDGSVTPIATELTEAERYAMQTCRILGRKALEAGDAPIGSVLLHNELGISWHGFTSDQATGHLLEHGELLAYDQAVPIVGSNLSKCTLVSTAQLCTSCTPHFAEGKVGKIVYAAPRAAVFEVAGIMRPRAINQHDLLIDGHTDTIVTEGFQAEEALELFAEYAKRKKGTKTG